MALSDPIPAGAGGTPTPGDAPIPGDAPVDGTGQYAEPYSREQMVILERELGGDFGNGRFGHGGFGMGTFGIGELTA